MKAKRKVVTSSGRPRRGESPGVGAPQPPDRSSRRGRARASSARTVGDRRLAPSSRSPPASVDLSVDLGRGLVLPNPILVASGTFGYGIEYGDVVDVDRLGAICCKGTTLQGRASATRRRA